MPRPLPRALRATSDAALRAKNDPAGHRATDPVAESDASRPSPRPRPRPHPAPVSLDKSASPDKDTDPAEAGTVYAGSTVRGVPFAAASRRLVAALAALAAVLAVASAVMFWQDRHAAAAVQAGNDARAAARTAAETLFSYDYRTIDDNIKAGKKVVTGKLATDYNATSAIVKPTAIDTKAVVKASVSEAAVVSAASDRVVVLMYLNQATQNKNLKATRMDMNRVRLTLVPVGGEWKISRAEPL